VQAQAVPVAEKAGPARRLRVLVAEDNDINALLITRTLEKMGCEPVLSRDGRSALDRAEAALAGNEPAFDLVLLDVRMPGLDGLSTARLIRAAELAAGKETRLPILAVSANVMEDDRRAALAAGMDDCLGKPLDREALATWIATLVSKRSAA
jgi:CheY-like chemotaxis protein